MSYAWTDVTEGQVASVEAINGLGQQVEALSQGGGWTPLTLAGGWTNYGGVFRDAAWRQLASGLVVCRGLIKGGSTTDGTPLALLPAEVGLTVAEPFPVASNGVTSAVYVTSDSIELQIGGSTVWLSLSGLAWLPD